MISRMKGWYDQSAGRRKEVEEYKPGSRTSMMYTVAADGYLTLEEAKRLLLENAHFRTIGETLARYCGAQGDSPEELRRRVVDLYLSSIPSAKVGSVEHKVRTWINGNKQYMTMDSALPLAFALKLPLLEDVEQFLCLLCGKSFHWRDPKDIVWIYAIRKKMKYKDALDLVNELSPLCELPKKQAEDRDTMTESIREKVLQLQSREELETFLRENASQLGKMHNTAFRLYQEYMNLLKTAAMDDLMPPDREMATEEILEMYLFNHLIPRNKKESKARETGKGSPRDFVLREAIRRDIKQNWPDQYELSRMDNRAADVTRKTLILLFLACDGGESEYGDYSEQSIDDYFEDACARLNSMLSDCGFPQLDSRVPFDWMVLYCMAAGDVTDIDGNISRFLTEIFRGNNVEEA